MEQGARRAALIACRSARLSCPRDGKRRGDSGKVVSDDDQKVVDAIRGGDSIESLTIEGDTDALLASQSAREAEWNKVLDSKR